MGLREIIFPTVLNKFFRDWMREIEWLPQLCFQNCAFPGPHFNFSENSPYLCFCWFLLDFVGFCCFLFGGFCCGFLLEFVGFCGILLDVVVGFCWIFFFFACSLTGFCFQRLPRKCFILLVFQRALRNGAVGNNFSDSFQQQKSTEREFFF